jgi:AcrR family transcriptional regulator
MATDAVRTARQAGASGEVMVRGDSAYGNSTVALACRRAGAQFPWCMSSPHYLTGRPVLYGFVVQSPLKARGRPRQVRADHAIVEATRSLIGERGYADTSVASIAARAGVGKDTIYRRWSSRAEVVYVALFTVTESLPAPDTGTLAEDLRVLVARLVAEFDDPAARTALPGLLADFAADPRLRQRIREDFLFPARGAVEAIFDRAAERDELRVGIPVEVVLDAIAGAVFFRLGLVGAPATPALVDTLTALFVDGIQAR